MKAIGSSLEVRRKTELLLSRMLVIDESTRVPTTSTSYLAATFLRGGRKNQVLHAHPMCQALRD